MPGNRISNWRTGISPVDSCNSGHREQFDGSVALDRHPVWRRWTLLRCAGVTNGSVDISRMGPDCHYLPGGESWPWRKPHRLGVEAIREYPGNVKRAFPMSGSVAPGPILPFLELHELQGESDLERPRSDSPFIHAIPEIELKTRGRSYPFRRLL